MIWIERGELGGIPKPEQQLSVGLFKQPSGDVLTDATAGAG